MGAHYSAINEVKKKTERAGHIRSNKCASNNSMKKKLRKAEFQPMLILFWILPSFRFFILLISNA